MIKIIETATKTVKTYKVTCHNCNTVFTCDDTDLRTVCFGHGEYADAVHCPTCYNDCTAYYGMDDFEEVEN